MTIIYVGIALALAGGALLALAMNVQRFALDVSKSMPHLFRTEIPRNAVWFFGLVL